MALRRYRAANNTRRWMTAVKEIVRTYNLTKSRAHGEIPMEVIKSKRAAWRALTRLLDRSKNQKNSNHDAILPKVGDYVRLSRIKHSFEKESTELGNFTREVFVIVSIDKTGDRLRFKIRDLNGNDIKGKAYLEEIQVIKYNPENYYEVEKILRTKMNPHGIEMAFVKWKGYNNRFNSWIEKSKVVTLDTDSLTNVS